MKRILVCGGRDFNNKRLLEGILDKLVDWHTPDEYGNRLPRDCVIIHGGARGADLLADSWAVTNWVPIEEFKADWKTYGKAAGPIRNKQMLEEGKPTMVLAFPGGTGTANMISQAKAAGIPVVTVKENSL